MTDSELKVMTALVIIGLRSTLKNGYMTPAATGTPTTLIGKGEEQLLPDVPHRSGTETPGPHQGAKIPFHQRHPRALDRSTFTGRVNVMHNSHARWYNYRGAGPPSGRPSTRRLSYTVPLHPLA